MWEKRGTASTLNEYMTMVSGCSIDNLMHPKAFAPEKVVGLVDAAELIHEAVNNNRQICVVGDYDADGVTSSAILFLLLKELGVTPRIRLPKRMSEGYGLSNKIIEDIAGQGFSNVGLGIVHSMAHSLGAVYDTPHGVANAIILPTVMEYNAPNTGEKYKDIAVFILVYNTSSLFLLKFHTCLHYIF